MTHTTALLEQSASGAAVLGRGDWYGRFVISWVFVYPLVWLTGLGGLFWVVAGIAGAVWLLRQRITGVPVLSLLLAGCLIASSVVGVLIFGFQVTRMISLFGNVLVWVAIGSMLVAAKTGALPAGALGRGVLAIAAAQGAVSFVAMLASPLRLPIPLLAPIAGSLPTGFAAFANNKLYFASWLDGVAYRSAGMSGQPTWAGALGALAIIIGLPLVFGERGRRRLLAIAGVAGGLFSMQLALSRSGWISLLLALVAGLILATKRYGVPAFVLAISWSLIAVAIVGLTSVDRIVTYLDELNAQREGSAETRGQIYATTWNYIHELPFAVFGYGIKPQESDLVASVATHSTYLGLIFRSGYLGLTIFALLLIVGLWIAVLCNSPQALAVFIFVAIWSVFEDFDPGHLVPLGVVWAFAVCWQSPRGREIRRRISWTSKQL